jgi:hypothetical protein
VYLLLLVAGFAGLIVMAVMGSLHGAGHGHNHHGHAHGDQGHALGHHGSHAQAHGAPAGQVHAAHGHAAHGHGAHGHDNANADGDADGDGDGDDGGANPAANALMWVMPFLSPLNWFSWLLGAGATGLLLEHFGMTGPVVVGAAAAGAIGFNMSIVKPIWRAVFSFASTPAGNLESCVMQTVEAVTAFNEKGEGLVRVTIDGRSEDVLAKALPERTPSTDQQRIRRGDLLLIEEVDTHNNTCRVTRA